MLILSVVLVSCVSGWGPGGFLDDLEGTENSVFYKSHKNVENEEISAEITENEMSGSGDPLQTDSKTEDIVLIDKLPTKTTTQLKTDIHTVITDITHPETSAYDCEDGYSVNPNNNKIIQLWTRLRYCSGVNIDSKYFSARLSLENKYRKSANPFRGYWSDAKVHSGYEFDSLVSLNIPYVGNVTVKVDQLIGTTGLVGFKGGMI